MAEDGGNKPLREIAKAFEDLALAVNSQDDSLLAVAPFSHACTLVSPLFGCLGIAFKFAERDYVAKVKDLCEASTSISTLQAVLEQDIQAKTVQKPGSHTRNLLRVKRGLDMVKLLFEHIILTEYVHLSTRVGAFLLSFKYIRYLQRLRGDSLKDAASNAYSQVFAPYHGWAIRKAVAAGMYALPTKAQLLRKLNEDENTAKVYMQSYVTSVDAVVRNVDKLYLSKDLGIDW